MKKIDLHVHSNNSDGEFSISQIFTEAVKRDIKFLSITDHDNIDGQAQAINLAKENDIKYIQGVELNVVFTDPDATSGKDLTLDLLGYGFDIENEEFKAKLIEIRKFRTQRIKKIFKNINEEFEKARIAELTLEDLTSLIKSVDGTIGRPHLAQMLKEKGKVSSIQEAFDNYLVRCNEPKYRFLIQDASKMIRSIGGKAVLAHPNDWHGTSLTKLSEQRYKDSTGKSHKDSNGSTSDYKAWLESDENLTWQQELIETHLLDYLDGIECWHSRHGPKTSKSYNAFSIKKNLIATGGSDCHQHPIMMGTLELPEEIINSF